MSDDRKGGGLALALFFIAVALAGVGIGSWMTKNAMANGTLECTMIEAHGSSARICYNPREDENGKSENAGRP